MRKRAFHKPLGVSVRVLMARLSSWGVVAALLVLAGLLLLLDFSWYEGDAEALPEAEDFVTSRAAQLDDPVGFKGFWLKQQGYTNKSSLEAVSRKQYRDAEKKLAAQMKQPGVICKNTCFKVCWLPAGGCWQLDVPAVPPEPGWPLIRQHAGRTSSNNTKLNSLMISMQQSMSLRADIAGSAMGSGCPSTVFAGFAGK